MGKAEALTFLKDMHDAGNDFDIDYLNCLFFPESSRSARVPSKFTFPTSTFNTKFSVYLNTGINGGGFVMFAPKDTTFYCLMQNNPTVAYTGNPTNAIL